MDVQGLYEIGRCAQSKSYWMHSQTHKHPSHLALLGLLVQFQRQGAGWAMETEFLLLLQSIPEGNRPCSAFEDGEAFTLQGCRSAVHLPLLFPGEMEAVGGCPCDTVSCSNQRGSANIFWQLVLDFYLLVGAGRHS